MAVCKDWTVGLNSPRGLCGTGARIDSSLENAVAPHLERGCKAHHGAASRTDGIAGEEAAEIDEVEGVGEVLPIDLELHGHALGLVDIDPRRRTEQQGGVDAPAGEINTVDHLLAVLLQRGLLVTVELKRKPAAVLNSAGHPETWMHLIDPTRKQSITLVLGIGKVS